ARDGTFFPTRKIQTNREPGNVSLGSHNRHISNERNIMLELNKTSTARNKSGTTHCLVGSVLLAGVLLLPARVLVAAPLISSFIYGFNTALTNNGSADSDARGSVRGNLNRRGVTD